MVRESILFGKAGAQIALAAVLLICQNLPVAGADNATAESQNANDAVISPVGHPRIPQVHQGLQVDEVNDVGYALQRIRQQAINIYLEAIRKVDSPAVTAELPTLTKVPPEIPKDMSNLLPFRRPWLVYFITTLEPLVHLLKQEVKDIDSGTHKIDVAPETLKAIDPLLKEWSQGVEKLDALVSEAASLTEDAEKNNVKLATIACELDKEVSELERVRDRAFAIIDRMEKDWKKPIPASRQKDVK
jgi:hypothetical protein